MNPQIYDNLTFIIVVGWLVLTPVFILLMQNRLRLRGFFRVYKYERLKRKGATEDEVTRELFRRELMKMPYFTDPSSVDAYVKKIFPQKATIREAAFQVMLIRAQKGIDRPLAKNPEEERKKKEKIWKLVRLYSNRDLTSINL